jgi:hypothetical protein
MITNSTRGRARALAGALALTLMLALGCALAGSAHAGSLAVFSCELPGGASAPTEGWASGWTGGPLPYAGSVDSCTSAGGALSSYIGAQTAQPGSSGPFWEYTAPAGFSLIGGQVTASFDIPGATVSGYSAATGILGPQLQFDAADVIGGLPGGEWGSVESTWSLAGHTGGHIWLYSFCEPPGDTCPADGSKAWYWSTDAMKQAILLLSNSTTPTASGFTGALTTPGAQTGTENLIFQAADSASGVYNVTVQLSGQTVYSGTPSTNGGNCVALGSYSGAPEFATASPCPHSESVTIPVDTAAAADGEHELTVSVTDAASNEAVVYSHQIETHNAPTTIDPAVVNGLAQVGQTLTATNATFTAPSGAGALSVISGQWMRCSDAAATHCSPIPSATSTSYQPQAADVGYYLAYTSTASDKDGTTSTASQPTTIVAGPPSPATSGSGITINLPTTASTLLGSNTSWAVTLKATPNTVHKGTTITLTGAVTTSPRPPAGKLIYLQARSIGRAWIGHGPRRRHIKTYGEWISFETLRTQRNGAWRSSYRFHLGGDHTYQMQAVAPQEGGFQNPTGTSNIVTITET